jgi:hypothetical protein
MRDNNYLEDRLYLLWENHFADVPRKNLVLIKFGKGSKRQLGSIKWVRQGTGVKTLLRKRVDEYKVQDDKRISLITITKYFKDERVPDYVVDGTIAHELVHYVHGFHSPLKQLYKHPHKGGIVKKELVKRGLGQVHRDAEIWLKKEWRKYLLLNHFIL